MSHLPGTIGEQIPCTELLRSQKYWWKADHALLQACYLILRRRKVRSSCSGRRRCRLLSDLVQFCPGSERGLNVATVRGWTSPPYFFTLAASPPITSKDMPSAVATRVHLTKHIIVDKSTELSQQERSQCYSHVYFTQHEHILTTDTKTLT